MQITSAKDCKQNLKNMLKLNGNGRIYNSVTLFNNLLRYYDIPAACLCSSNEDRSRKVAMVIRVYLIKKCC